MILAVYSIMEVKKDEQEKSYNYYYFAYMLISIVDCTNRKSRYSFFSFRFEWWSFGNSWKYYYTQQGTTNYSNNIISAISSWQTATSKLSVSKATAPYGNVVVTSKNFGNTGWDGITYINLRIDLQDSVVSSNRTELVAHEFGHGFGLDHFSCSYELMRAFGYKGSATPYEGDIAGINALY